MTKEQIEKYRDKLDGVFNDTYNARATTLYSIAMAILAEIEAETKKVENQPEMELAYNAVRYGREYKLTGEDYEFIDN